MDELATINTLPALNTTLDDVVRSFMAAEHAPSTRRAYAADCRHFVAWCRDVGAQALPADKDDIARYLAALADSGAKASTITRRRAAIKWAHQAAGHISPTDHKTVSRTLRGIRRTIGTRPAKKAAIILTDLLRMLDHVDRTTRTGKRDYALLVISFSAALRRSEVAQIMVEHLTFMPSGVSLLIPHSKTDQEGAGQTVAMLDGRHIRPTDAIRDWMQAAGINAGPLLRAMTKHGTVRDGGVNDRLVAEVVKRYAIAAGLDPATVSGHSMRAGWITSAAMNGADALRIMDVSRHRDINTIREYVRIADQFKSHAGGGWM